VSGVHRTVLAADHIKTVLDGVAAADANVQHACVDLLLLLLTTWEGMDMCLRLLFVPHDECGRCCPRVHAVGGSRQVDCRPTASDPYPDGPDALRIDVCGGNEPAKLPDALEWNQQPRARC